MRLNFRAGDDAVYLVVAEAQAEDFEPGVGIRFGAVEELEGRGQLPVDTAGDVVENYGAIAYGPVPILLRNLFLGEAGAGHLDEGSPGVFDENLGALSLGGGDDDLDLLSFIHWRHLPPMSLRSKSESNWRGRWPTSDRNWEKVLMISFELVDLRP